MYYINVFKDKENNIIIIPNARCEHGFHVESNFPETLNYPYSEAELGAKAKTAMQSVIAHPFLLKSDATHVFETVTGKKWVPFAKQRHCVDFRLNIGGEEFDERFEKGYRAKYKKRTAKNSFGNLVSDPEFSEDLPLNAGDEEIGAAILRIFSMGINHYKN